MRKATTILRLIDNLEQELFQNYSAKEIQKALEKENKKTTFIGGTDGLISVIWERCRQRCLSRRKLLK